MKIKVTDVAQRQLDRMDPAVRALVIAGVRDGLPAAITTDPSLTLTDGTEARIHTFGKSDPVLLYRMFDVNGEGELGAVILTIIERDVVSLLTKPAPFAGSILDSPDAGAVPGSIRVARELISKIRAAES